MYILSWFQFSVTRIGIEVDKIVGCIVGRIYLKEVVACSNDSKNIVSHGSNVVKIANLKKREKGYQNIDLDL